MIEGLYTQLSTQLGGEQDSGAFLGPFDSYPIVGIPWKFGFLHLGQIQFLESIYRISCVSLHMFYFIWHFAKQGLLLFYMEKTGENKTKKNSIFLGASTRTLLQIQCPQWCCHMGSGVNASQNLNPRQ